MFSETNEQNAETTLKLLHTCCAALLLLLGSVNAEAAIFYVHCGATVGLNSIGAALKALKNSEASGTSTVNVSGHCEENVVIQGIDRFALNAVNGASITDASSGALDVISVVDSHDVTINGFSISGGYSGISCLDGALCRLVNDTIQGAAGNGVGVYTLGQARLAGVKLLNSSTGLFINHGGQVVGDAIMQGNNRGLVLIAGGVAFLAVTITQSQDVGVFATTNSTLDCTACTISGNAADGVLLRQSSSARFLNGSTVASNGGAGVRLSELSSALFIGSTVTGNAGGIDVLCGPQFTSASGAKTDIGGGKTNCIEPSP